jgi:N-acetylneuraminic acid mutarotase
MSAVTPSEPKGGWLRINDFPGEARSGGAAFTIGDKAYFGLGYNHGASKLSDMWEYSVASDSWTRKADFNGFKPTAAFSTGGKGYILDEWGLLYEYDPARDAWSRKESVPGVKRWAVSGFAIAGKAYAGMKATQYDMEQNNIEDKLEFWEYSPADDAWARIADFPGKTQKFATTLTVRKKAYFGIGWTGDGSGTTTHDIWEYDPLKDSWQQKEDYPGISPSSVTGLVFSNEDRGYVASTMDPDTLQAGRVWEFNPEKDSWRQVQHFPNRNHLNSTAFTIGGKTYAVGGFWTIHSRQVWVFDPKQ